MTSTAYQGLTRTKLLPVLLLLVIGLAIAVSVAQAAAPDVTTGPAEQVTNTSATLTGTVNPRGVETTYYFEYGTSGSFGSRTPSRSAGNNNSAVTVRVPIAGLTANTQYHYRLVAVGDGTTRGKQETFRAVTAVIPEPSKLELARATIDRSSRSIDILAPITARASGRVSLELFAAGQVHRWTAPINSSDARIRDREPIPAAQAAKGTGILTIRYAGDPDTRPQTVRLRAANNRANLDASRPTLTGGVLRANGTISSAARGVVRVQLEYYSGGKTTTLEKNATIANGSWRLEAPLTAAEQAAINGRRGVVHSYILFTGYLRANMRGEMVSYEVLPAR